MTAFEISQLVVLLSTLGFVGYQVRLQSQESRKQSKLQSFQLYHLLVQQYTELLSRADRDADLNQIWELPDAQRKEHLDKAHAARDWGAWYEMRPEEKRGYRYIRYAIETFEQAYLAHQRGWIDDETWQKWRGWMAVWRHARYFKYVFEDSRPRLVSSFVQDFERVTELPTPHIATMGEQEKMSGSS